MSNGEIAIPAAFGWKDQDWAELLACMRLRKVIPVIGEELLQVEIEGETVPLYTWMAKRLAGELDIPPGELASPASLNDVACLYLERTDSKRNSIYTRLWIIMDEAKGNLRLPRRCANWPRSPISTFFSQPPSTRSWNRLSMKFVKKRPIHSPTRPPTGKTCQLEKISRGRRSIIFSELWMSRPPTPFLGKTSSSGFTRWSPSLGRKISSMSLGKIIS